MTAIGQASFITMSLLPKLWRQAQALVPLNYGRILQNKQKSGSLCDSVTEMERSTNKDR